MTSSTPSPRAVVVGATSRTGEAVARRLGGLGWSMTLTSRDARRTAGLREEIEASGSSGAIETAALDLADAASIDSFIRELDLDRPIDLLVVCGAPFSEDPIDSWSMPKFLEQAAAQAAGPALVAAGLRDALTLSTRAGGGAVVLFGDIHARLRPRPGAAPYLAGKAALESLVPILACEMAPTRVFGIAPGVIAWAEEFDEERRRRYLERVPLGREGTVEEAASLVLALAEHASYTTGIVVPIDGGRHLR